MPQPLHPFPRGDPLRVDGKISIGKIIKSVVAGDDPKGNVKALPADKTGAILMDAVNYIGCEMPPHDRVSQGCGVQRVAFLILILQHGNLRQYTDDTKQANDRADGVRFTHHVL